jgi:hypothetical protein
MEKPLLFSDLELEELAARAKGAAQAEPEVRAYLGGRFRPEVATFYAHAPTVVVALVHEILRLRAELQQSLRMTVRHVDEASKRDSGD